MNRKCINYLILTERELVFLLKSDDIDAFEQLYHNYKTRLYRNILRIVKTEEKTEALLQEVFSRIWATRGDIDPTKPFRVHLFKVAESLIYDFFRKAALNKKIENHFITVATSTVNGVQKQTYHKGCNELLAPRTTDVYVLRETESRIYDHTTRLPGISVTGINGHIIKASQTMRKFFRLGT